jgi:hypothetical protein
LFVVFCILLNEETSILELSRVCYKHDLLKFRSYTVFQVSLYIVSVHQQDRLFRSPNELDDHSFKILETLLPDAPDIKRKLIGN